MKVLAWQKSHIKLDHRYLWLIGLALAIGVASRLSVTKVVPSLKAPAVAVPKVSAPQRLLLGEKIDLNRAGFAELVALPGIGPKLARAIMNNRREKGPFPTIQSLTRVRGIGPKKLKRIEGMVVVTPLPDR